MRALFKISSFRRLFIGQTASMFGDSLMLLALAVWVKDLTGSNGAAGLTMFFLAAPLVAAPLTGWLVDRFTRKSVLLAGNIGTAVCLSPLLLVRGADQVWVIYAVALVYGWSFLVLGSAIDGFLKDTVPDESLGDANGAMATVKQGWRLIGPLGGVGLYAWSGPTVVVLIDIASFLIAALFIWRIKAPQRVVTDPAADRMRAADLARGLRFVVETPRLRRGVLALAVCMGMLGMIEVIGFTLVEHGLRRSNQFVGVIVTMQGIGALAGGLVAAALVRRFGELASVGIGVVLAGVSIATMATAQLHIVLVAMFLMGLGLPIAMVGGRTLLQRSSPADLIGRVSSAVDALIGIPQTAAIAAGAVLVLVVDYRILLVIMGVVITLAGCLAWQGRRPVMADQADNVPDHQR